MTSLEPKVNFGELSDTDITTIGLDAAEASFDRDVAVGLTNGDSLIIVVGFVEDGTWHELGRRGLGPDSEQFADNVDPETGKLATSLEYAVESVVAYHRHGANIPEDARRFTGGVFHVARVKTVTRGWLTRDFAGAASGVQGHLDMAAVYAALLHMGAAWALKMQAHYGRAA